ncbi:hypothetical protein [Rhizobium paknamense]|uniref:Uncharacterized protein n=1 Tax=Rhizobium paknamense TaxID=1206817 RepID=A0ABU0IAF6_9HYPH|nr:hypothetical protein [Rhizobium paknamense]MDQ0454687.1 hypothetical protein [Rhizobium paknamense]
MTKRFVFNVTTRVAVYIEPEKLAPLMPEFNASISDFGDGEDALERHAEHIAQLAAHGVCDFNPNDFVEGYGIVKDAGIDVIVTNDVICERLGGAA